MSKLKFEPLLKEIYRLSKKVSSDLPFHATGIEKQLQEALAYEFRKASKPIEAVREFFSEIYYKDFPVKDSTLNLQKRRAKNVLFAEE